MDNHLQAMTKRARIMIAFAAASAEAFTKSDGWDSPWLREEQRCRCESNYIEQRCVDAEHDASPSARMPRKRLRNGRR